MKGNFGTDLTTGGIPGHMIRFAMPVLLGNLLTTGYGIINAIWVGNLLGRDAVGAVAVSFPLFLGMLALTTGASIATTIMISRAYGAKNLPMIRKVVNNSASIAIFIIILIPAAGILFSGFILKALGTPDEIMPIASSYLKITFISFIFMYLSTLVVSILRGIGNTVTPMTFIIISTVINAILDPVLIMGLGPIPRLGLNGAAFATLIASSTATIAGIIYSRVKYRDLPVNPSGLSLEGYVISKIVMIGLPSFIQQILISMGYGFITVFVNSFGPPAIAAFGIAGRIDGIVAMPAMAVMMSVSALTAQNLGANKPERIKEIFKWGIIVNIPVVLSISMLCYLFPETVMKLFVRDPEVIVNGIKYFHIVGLGYLFYTLIYVSNGVINGAGKTITTMLITLVSLCLVRIPFAGFLSRTGLGIDGIWLAIVMSLFLTAITSLLYYLSGRWKKRAIPINPAVKFETEKI